MIDNFLVHLFHEGQCLEAYKVFGCHRDREHGVDGRRFTVYAPNASTISVVGNFNNWNCSKNPLQKISDSVWTTFVPELGEFENYKYAITTYSGEVLYKADPYAYYSELRPGTTSLTYDLEGFTWSDEKWLKKQDKHFEKNMNIYEVHFGSWKRKDDDSFYTYIELAKELIPYVLEMGYTHIEFMPLSEHPFDGSWGYQTTGYFSATSRYGTPHELMTFIDECHKAGIGVIMDFVPVHYVKDAHGLYMFDGGYTYEYPSVDQRYSEWGSVYFDLGRDEVRSFMMSSISFWIEKYHVDGIRFDAISHLIYHKGNKERGTNDGAIDFMKRMTYLINQRSPRVILIAEDSSDYPKVTKSSVEGGLGFDYKWDLGWMNDTLKYMGIDPLYRKYDHNLITFSMAYFYGENFILPFSHDEVVHSKGTIVDKIFGTHEQKFAQLRTLYTYMLSHPGKVLNFMSNELGEYLEWDESKSLGWSILEYPIHDSFHRYMKELNYIKNKYQALHQLDYYPDAYQWLVVDDHDQSVFAYQRKDNKQNKIVVVLNFGSNYHDGYRIPVSDEGIYHEILNSDQETYGGTGVLNGDLQSIAQPELNQPNHIKVKLAPFSSSIFVVEKQGEKICLKTKKNLKNSFNKKY